MTNLTLNEYIKQNLPNLVQVKRVNRHTRAGKNGKQITCPMCNKSHNVFHFSWSALTCQSCKQSINKEDWILEVIKHEMGS